MGIQGLLPQLKSIQQPVSLHRYSGQTLAIDGYAWLHRAAHSCAMELALGRSTDKYLQFFIKRLSMLRATFKVEPYLIFDGDSINVKKDTERKRRQKRDENKEKGLELWKSGDNRQSYEYFQKSVDITPEMAKCIMEYCQSQNIKYLVAPFEADAQMVYLEKEGFVHGIISEDSDLLIFGCRKLITKLNDHGDCIEICRDDFVHLPSRFPLCQLSPQEIRTMVCLSGCDYTSGIPQVGLLTAMKLVKRYKTIERVIQSIQREGKLKIPKEFLQEYELANFAFQFQRVFCPQRMKLVTLNDIPHELSQNETIFQCIGQVVSKEDGIKKVMIDDNKIDHNLHRRISVGELNPRNFHKPLINRERKLNLVSRSEPILKKTAVPTCGSIDSFFSKRSVKIGSVKAPASVATSIADDRNRKVETTVERRKLSRVQTGIDGGVSKFFNSTKNGSSALVDLHMSASDGELRIQSNPSINNVDFQISNIATKTDMYASRPPSSQNLDSTADDCQEDLSTELPSSMLSTEIPSSMIPTQTDQEQTPFSEEESEILSEVEEAAIPDKQYNAFANKRHCKSIADLRDNFSYRRTPLQVKSTNTRSHSVANPQTTPSHGKLVVVKAKRSATTSCVNPVARPPALSRSSSRLISRSSPAAQKPTIRSLSLAEFVYKGE
ncbi:LAFE_0D08262g1_1 [Lachancea fermentati]|uniref:LAFE_0D08262g1_1 n=1 Tax=Lachancea fermentati TaxID=4955 RepID=A0A1G4MBL1_LACFM|nr:LAFE_0D08262g1_1 [Lachancea fermentati]